MSNMQNVQEMPLIRIFFEKRDRAKYISHLDINRCMQRALKRAGVPVWYTEGFHPHAYITFALPISLGFESLCETMDLRIMQAMPFEEIQERMNGVLPRGIRVVKVDQQRDKPGKIAWAEYQIRLYLKNSSGEEAVQKLSSFSQREQILVEKRSKKGIQEIDLKPHVQILSLAGQGDWVEIKLRTAAGNTLHINPTLYLDAFAQETGTEILRRSILRTAVLEADGKAFA